MFTIRNFLNLELIPWYKNLTNQQIPEERPIEYVSVNDLPLDHFIRKNEMVISIATPYVKDETLMTEFIAGLIELEASIFILAIPGNNIKLNENCIRLAENGNLPVLMIPWEVRFADICETILLRLRNDYNETMEEIKKLQNDILKSFLDGMDINAATKIISKRLHCDVSIARDHDSVINTPLPNQTKILLESGGHLYGVLYLNIIKDKKWADLISRSLSPLLSLWFYRDEIIETTQKMAKDDLIWSLANGSDPKSEQIQRTAKFMGLSLNRTYACIVGRVQLKGNHSNEWQKNWMDANINTIRNTFIKIAGSLGKKAMVTLNNNAIVTYLEISKASGKSQISKFLDLIEDHLKLISKNLLFFWGISEIKDGTTDFRNYYLHARLAEELCSNDMRLGKRYYYENTLIYTMMSTLSTDETFMKSAYDMIAPLIEYDKTKSANLVETLRIFLSCKNIAETARKLKRHRQTLLYQLEKIEDLTGISLKNNDEVFLLEVCMRLQIPFYPTEDVNTPS